MRTLLRQSMITAIILTNSFLAASTPIPGTDSGLVVPESLNDNNNLLLTTNIVNLPISVESDNELGLLARNPTDEANDTEQNSKQKPEPNLVTIPPGFLPDNSRSSTHELKMKVPGKLDLTCWGSVLNIVNLMDEAAKKDPKELNIPRNTFKKELEKIDHFQSVEALAKRVRDNRPDMTWIDKTQYADLEGLRRRIEEAVLQHNEFEGEIKIPEGFLPENKPLWMKVPSRDNEQAVNSVYLITELLRSATSKNEWKLADRLSSFRYVLTNGRFHLPLPKPIGPVNGQASKEHLVVTRELIQHLVEQHNDNKWVKDADVVIPEVQENGEAPDADNTEWSPEHAPTPTARRRTVKITKTYFLPKACPKDMYMNIPPSDHEEGVQSVNQIMELMTHVGGKWEMWRSWKGRRDVLTSFGLQIMPEPKTWPNTPDTPEEGEHRRQMVLDAVTKHNKRQGEWRKEQTQQRSRVKRPVGGPQTQTQAPSLRVWGQQEGANSDAGKEQSQLLPNIVGPGRGMIEGQTSPIPQHPGGQGGGTHEHQGPRSTSGRTFDPVRETFV